MPIDDHPDQEANRDMSERSGAAVAVIEQGNQVGKSKAPRREKAKKGNSDIPTIYTAAVRTSPSTGSFAYLIVRVIEDDEDPHRWRTP